MSTITSLTDLKLSTQGRAGTPDGNYFIDYSNPDIPRVQLIAADELAQIDFGSGLVANPLIEAGGPDGGTIMAALYAAFGRDRLAIASLRRYLKPGLGTYEPAGAYQLRNAHVMDTAKDLKLIRGSGLEYLSVAGNVSRRYAGPKSLGNIESASQPYFQTALNGPSTDFTNVGPVDEMIQVFGTTAFGDASAGNFDDRNYLAISVRTWGQIHDRKDLSDSQIASAEAFSIGLGLTEAPHPTTGTYDEADVSPDLSPVAPWNDMLFRTESSPVSRTGFNEADGNFSKTIVNPAAGGAANLNELLAYCDALARSTNDIDSGTPTRIGKDNPVLYEFTQVGDTQFIDFEQGVYPEGLGGAELVRVRLRDDAGNLKTHPESITVNVGIPAPAVSDPSAVYHAFIEDDEDTANDYNTGTALTAQDTNGNDIVGLVAGQTTVSFDLNFSAVPGGTTWEAGDPYVIRFIVFGDPTLAGSAVEEFVLINVDGSSSIINTAVVAEIETNAGA